MLKRKIKIKIWDDDDCPLYKDKDDDLNRIKKKFLDFFDKKLR